MDHELFRAALFILVAVTFYAILARGLFKVTEPYRIWVLDIAEKLNHSPALSAQKRAFIYRRLGEVYSHWQAWGLVAMTARVLVALPFQDVNARIAASNADIPSHLRDDYDKFKMYWMVATIGNSPAAALLFTTILIVASAFFASISVISGAVAFTRDHHNGHGANAA